MTKTTECTRTIRFAVAAALSAMCGSVASEQGIGPIQLRQFIDQRVGGIEKLIVPALDTDIPQPRLDDGSLDPRFKTTEAKRYLGKLLFFDPVRTARILPQYGGELSTKQTASCGSCHLGEAASRAGTIINLGVGGEGRGYTDAAGQFIPRRRIQPGFVDTVPTLTEICAHSIGLNCALPSNGLTPEIDMDTLVTSGRADAVDSVPRNAPTLIGAAFSNRLLQGGLAGDLAPPPIGINPDGNAAQENVAGATTTVHRMAQLQAAELQRFPAFVKLFKQAFPDEAAAAKAQDDLNLLVNDDTVARAMATFMRTVVTRNTPYDRFLAGDNSALTAAQRRGAKLFFTSARNGEGGAGCISCHSGPILNKQLGDEAGVLVDENFVNLGLHDHVLQELNATVLHDPRHRDIGRMEVTGKPDDAFQFRVLSMRQLKDGGGLFMHNGTFTSVTEVVQYFNAGVPQDVQAAAAGTLDRRFTFPRGRNRGPGLGLDEAQVNDVTDFLVNALYDPAFVRFDPRSTTKTFQLNKQDLTYSVYRPDLAALGAVDGLPISGLAQSNNDALTRRDAGLEFLDVTAQTSIKLIDSDKLGGGRQRDVYRISNNSPSIVDTHLLMVTRGLPREIVLENGSGSTTDGDPYRRLFLSDGVLLPGQSLIATLFFKREPKDPPVRYTLGLLSGQGNP